MYYTKPQKRTLQAKNPKESKKYADNRWIEQSYA
jgi:hypothetical protein